ncbi:hypothetical protein C8R44DRAFT_794667 [Mycena epipterygia]|nr:hypothetical protein C8R44DRAFT_794667 [Mycena epipterygia]
MGKAKDRAWDFFHRGGRRYQCPFTEEERLMELLGAENSDEEPDDGELEGSGDDYDEE